MSFQHTNFEDRLARIRAGSGTTKSTVFVGQEGRFTYIPKARRGNGGMGDMLGNAGYALSFPFCLAIGFLSNGLERYADFVMNPNPDPNASIDLAMVKSLAIAFCVTVVVTYLLGMRDKGLLVPKLIGVVAGLTLFHNLVHLWPQIFEQLFSPMWMAKVTAMTEPSSFFWRGISFPF